MGDDQQTTQPSLRIKAASQSLRHRVAYRLGLPMFVAALIFLICQAILVVILVDVPNLSENAINALDLAHPQSKAMRQSLAVDVVDHRVTTAAIVVMLLIWPVVILEAIFGWVTRPWDRDMRKYHVYGLMHCVCPSLRLCARSPDYHNRMWLPGYGWRSVNRRLRKRLERRFSAPMILIALLIMPILIVEFFLKTQVAQYAWLRLTLHVGTGIIWFAFAGEFIVMVSVAEKKLRYCKEHWIDLAIIVLPLFSFLRSLRLFRVMGLANALRVSQLSKLARVYRLRGTAVKALRALVLLDVFYRVLGIDVSRRIMKLERKLEDVESEAKEIRRQISKLQRQRDAEHDSVDQPAADRG